MSLEEEYIQKQSKSGSHTKSTNESKETNENIPQLQSQVELPKSKISNDKKLSN